MTTCSRHAKVYEWNSGECMRVGLRERIDCMLTTLRESSLEWLILGTVEYGIGYTPLTEPATTGHPPCTQNPLILMNLLFALILQETRSQTASPALSERSVASTASEPSPNCAKDRSFQSFSVVANRGSAVDSNHPKTVTLRQQQVLRLKQEMNDPKGIRVRLRRKDCITSLALVDCFGCVW